MNIKEEADKKSNEFMNRLVKISPMHKADNILYEATRLNYLSGFMAGAYAQQKIDTEVMYDNDELIAIAEKMSHFLLDKMQGRTKMTPQEFILTLKKL